MRSLFPVLLISIAAGCTAKPPSPPPSATPPLAGPPPGIVLIAAHEAAGPDETVLLSLSNTLDHFIRIEPICDIEVQVQVDG
ncbi:hypothetical protein KJ554_08780 [bacterium]|nr:hypothetical protein [bacterium]